VTKTNQNEYLFQVCTAGSIHFDGLLFNWDAHIPLDPMETIIAPFWSGLHGSHKSGITLFRQTTDLMFLNALSGDIQVYFPMHSEFAANGALVATWYNIPHCCQCETDTDYVRNISAHSCL